MSAAGHPVPRGTMVDIGQGRQLRLVCEGPASGVDASDGLAGGGGLRLRRRLGRDPGGPGAAGWRSCAYDRAGMGFSPPGPAPRDGLAIVEDFEKLVAASGEKGPFILVGHSMAGLRLREYAGRNPRQGGGPGAGRRRHGRRLGDRGPAVHQGLHAASRWAARGASIGLYKPLVYTSLGDKIGLPPAAKAEKRWAFANGRHNRTAAAEVALWPASADQAVAEPAYDPALAGGGGHGGPVKGREKRKAMQVAPAERSKHGYVDHVEAATHTRLLGEQFAGHIVKAVEFVAGKGG
jgi:hypothetical protein